MLKKILSLLWTGFCLVSISHNWTHYSILDFIIVITVTTLPFVIYKLVSKKKSIKHNSSEKSNNTVISQTTNPPNRQEVTPTQNSTLQPQAALPNNFTPTNNIPNVTPGVYSAMQADGDLRILNDCINLMQSTTNFETFFNRYELAIQKSLTLEQAGINLNSSMASQAIIQLKINNLERILQATYEKEISAINSLKTTKGKINRINKFLESLLTYKDDLKTVNNYKNIVISFNELKKELRTEQNTLISEDYQAAYQRAIADAEQIKERLESLETERYQILGEPDCNHYDICAQKNGKVYALSSYKIGQTAPPFHEKCTCTVVPYFDDEF